jgi:hypothetical protein
MRCYYKGTFRDKAGNPVSSGTANVYLAGTTTAASVYTSLAGATAVNSVTSGDDGTFEFWVSRFDYDIDQKFKIVLSKDGYTSATWDNVAIDQIVLGTYSIATDTAVATALNIPKGVLYSITSGKTLTFSQQPEIGPYQVFTGDGSVAGLTYADVRWWGATLDYSTDNAASVQKAIDAVYSATALTGGWVYVPPRCKYLIKTQDHVQVNSKTYRCLISHTSGVFADDLAAGKWEEVDDTTDGYGIAWVTGTDYAIANASGVVFKENVHVIDDSVVYKRRVIMNGNSSGPWNEFLVEGGYHPGIVIDVHSNWPLNGTFGATQGRGNRSGLLFRTNGDARWQFGNDIGLTGADDLSLIRNYPSTKQMFSHTIGGRTRYGALSSVSTNHAEPTYHHQFEKSVAIEEQSGTSVNLVMRVIDTTTGAVVNNAQKMLTVDTTDGQFHLKNSSSAPILTFNDDGPFQTLQPAPTVTTAISATLTIAEILTRIIQATPPAPVTYTLPLGTDCDDEPLFTSIKNASFDWTIINLSGALSITLTANTGHTIVGNAVVALSTSGTFRTRRANTDTFITYRIA